MNFEGVNKTRKMKKTRANYNYNSKTGANKVKIGSNHSKAHENHLKRPKSRQKLSVNNNFCIQQILLATISS